MSLFSLAFFLLPSEKVTAQANRTPPGGDSSASEWYRMLKPDPVNYRRAPQAFDTTANRVSPYPEPKKVLYKSLMIPGWGQVVNRQIWKVPVIYGLLGGLGWYSVYLTKRYHDYRAAFYNATHDSINPDFGETPDYIPADARPEELRLTRNKLRNRRDFIYVTIGLAYGLNAIDAYVFAHLRSFDVSEDLSMKTRVGPAVLEGGTPGLTLTVNLMNGTKATE